MSKFVIFFGKNSTPGTAGTLYEIYDIVTFDAKKDIANQMRKYCYREFYNLGRKAKTMRKDVYCRRRHVFLKKNGSIFAEKVKIYDHSLTNEYFAFIPKECFEW